MTTDGKFTLFDFCKRQTNKIQVFRLYELKEFHTDWILRQIARCIGYVE